MKEENKNKPLQERIKKEDSFRESLRKNPKLIENIDGLSDINKLEAISRKVWKKHIEPVEKVGRLNNIGKIKELTLPEPFADYIDKWKEIEFSYKNLSDKVTSSFQKFGDSVIQACKKEMDELARKKEEAENNPYYQILLEDNEELSIEIRELSIIKESLEILLSDKLNEQATRKAKRSYYKQENLSPKISKEKQNKLYNRLKTVFTATPEQWEALFSSEKIRMNKPIEAKANIDVGLFLVQLYKKGFIGTKEYAAIAGRTKAFSVRGKILTAEQITATKDRFPKWHEDVNPVVGKNYEQINKAFLFL